MRDNRKRTRTERLDSDSEEEGSYNTAGEGEVGIDCTEDDEGELDTAALWFASRVGVWVQ